MKEDKEKWGGGVREMSVANPELLLIWKVKVAQSCPTFCNPMDYNPPGSSVHEILQEIILEWVAISFSRGSSRPRDQTWVSCIASRFFTIWATKTMWKYGEDLSRQVSSKCKDTVVRRRPTCWGKARPWWPEDSALKGKIVAEEARRYRGAWRLLQAFVINLGFISSTFKVIKRVLRKEVCNTMRYSFWKNLLASV